MAMMTQWGFGPEGMELDYFLPEDFVDWGLSDPSDPLDAKLFPSWDEPGLGDEPASDPEVEEPLTSEDDEPLTMPPWFDSDERQAARSRDESQPMVRIPLMRARLPDRQRRYLNVVLHVCPRCGLSELFAEYAGSLDAGILMEVCDAKLTSLVKQSFASSYQWNGGGSSGKRKADMMACCH